MPPRKKANKIVNEEVEKKIKSFVNTANEKDCESSDEEYNIYVKSARAELPEFHRTSSERRESSKSETSETTARAPEGVVEPNPVSPSGARAEKVLKSKSKARVKTKITLSDEVPVDPNEKLYKMFDEYKNELNELRNIVKPPKIENIIPPTPTPLIDVRRAMMQLKFG
jgi:hypothetical protein